MTEKDKDKINCYKCKFFRITWNPKYPYACRAHAFKGRNLPSREVLTASGVSCMSFELKTDKKEKPEKNYPDYI